ncbi:TIGR01244 family phosphatase [Motiliproteus coralliicola]|uniref:TIGR01244 family phosphatase n=1 Tax=Motiliproteus coralliicola TaxID=2283196 RepID=A0A369WAP3_9GAMM|nr:bifunctional protein tyrosine phosphatase family protein/NAD(P)/FAD-dependent oxidoreductase [Motiliproteus coralliicola]RDE19080.1 TIGR01244 family phosphatase [Motiliproteus coralliicola]
MDVHQLSPFISVCSQITAADVGLAASMGFKAIMSNRPDNESEDQPANDEIREACERHGVAWYYLPVISGQITDENAADFREMMAAIRGPVLAFCRTGTRCCTLWALAEAPRLDVEAILKATEAAGYDLSAQRERINALANEGLPAQAITSGSGRRHDVLIVGGGAGGQSVAASLLKRKPDLNIAIIEPRTEHFYQPGWTLVGGGVFERKDTVRPMEQVMPDQVKWYHAAASTFEPKQQQVVLEDGERIGYRMLVVSPGLRLDWDAIPGLRETLGSNGVTSNYLFDLAPYTWDLVQSTRKGKSLFTQPPMPIKCAGAPQKAMYLACDYWHRNNRLGELDIQFCNAGGALFGVADYVPALMEYIEKYGIELNFMHNLAAVDGQAKTALFKVTDGEGQVSEIEKPFDMIHVCPPQKSPKFIADSPLADADGWLDLSPETMQHKQFGDIFGLGDGGNTPNAKTAAAVRKQAPVVAENVLRALEGEAPRAIYDGYGSCPLTVERGKIVLAEFGYGGKLLPTFPNWLVQGTRPSKLSWLLKEKMLPWLYWEGMLKGREWLAKPEILAHNPAVQDTSDACDWNNKP